jgi:hypothetical protein
MESNAQIPGFIQHAMADASDAELRQAAQAFHEYMAAVWDICRRVSRDDDDSLKMDRCDRVE